MTVALLAEDSSAAPSHDSPVQIVMVERQPERQPGVVGDDDGGGGGAWLSIMPWTSADCWAGGEPKTTFFDEAYMLDGKSWKDAGCLSEPKHWYRLPTDEEID